MLSSLISIIFILVIAGVVFWAVQQLLALIPMAEPFATIVRVLCVLLLVLVVLWVLVQLLGVVGVHVPILR